MEKVQFMKINIDNWEWEIDDPGILEPWFADFKSHLKTASVKSNAQRDVFIVESGEKKYYVKYSHPSSLLQKTRSKILSKSASEYNSAKLLKAAGVSTPEVVGWGKKGSESMLLFEEIPNTVNARKYWFSIPGDAIDKKERFLADFADFLKKFFNSDLYHPDFHPGNLLVTEKNGSVLFTLIDPYGVVEMKPVTKAKAFEMLCIVGAFRGEITDVRGTAFIQNIFPELDKDNASEQWWKIITAESVKTGKLWEKRKGRILSDSRYSQVFKQDNRKIRIRKSLAENIVMQPDEVLAIDKNNPEYTIIELDPAAAEKLWIKSFRTEFHRLPQALPLAWIQTPSAKDTIISQNEINTVLSTEEIERRTQLA